MERATPNMTYASRLSASVFSHSRSIQLQRLSRSYKSSTSCRKIRSSVVSWQPRAKLRLRRRPTPSLFRLQQEQQKAKPQIRAKNTSTIAMLERKIGSCAISNQTKLNGFVNHQSQHSSEPYASTSESDSDDFDGGALMARNDQRDQFVQTSSSVTTQIMASKAKPSHKIRGIKLIITFRGGRVPGSFHRSPFSVVTALVPLAYKIAKRSRPFTDEASKYTGASSKSKLEGKSVLALAAVRHRKSSSLISGQEKMDRLQFPGAQAPGDRSHKIPEWL